MGKNKAEIAKVTSKLKSREKELDELRSKVSEFEGKLTKLNSDNMKLAKDCKKAKMMYEESERSNQSLRDNMAKIMSDIE